ncbi:MAG: sigma-70 family RNA polymerase sigma factor [Clostridium sp.]|uniref:RNA polymerase sigma factor n=1 Tax=Clostridium sp. TaxID=1506 RepID=UPI002FCA3B69
MFTLGRVSKKEFEEFVVENQVYLYKMAFTYLKSEEDALDIVQESILKAYKSLRKIENKNYLKTYVTRIVINTSLTYMKKEKRTLSYSQDILEAIINKNSAEDNIEVNLEILDDELRGIIVLKYYYGYTIREVSEILLIKESDVKNRIHKALNLLRKDIKEDNYE